MSVSVTSQRPVTAGAGAPALGRAAGCAAGRAQLASIFRLCAPLDEPLGGQARRPPPPPTEGDVAARLKALLLNVFDTLAMGNFPYPSNYLVFQQTQDPSVMLPAWPFRAACKHFAGAANSTPPAMLLERMARAAEVLYNASGKVACNALPTDPNFDGIWDYQWCTERLPQETYFSLTGTSDMFCRRPHNRSAVAAHCEKKYGVGTERVTWIAQSSRVGATAGSNILFSNGQYDPWRSGGVLHDLSPSLRAIEVANGAHHLDLFFSNPADPPSVRAAREVEVAAMKAWSREAASRRESA